jgi:hypothetical protein
MEPAASSALLFGGILFLPDPPHHSRIGALHGDSEAAAAARRTAAGRLAYCSGPRTINPFP